MKDPASVTALKGIRMFAVLLVIALLLVNVPAIMEHGFNLSRYLGPTLFFGAMIALVVATTILISTAKRSDDENDNRGGAR